MINHPTHTFRTGLGDALITAMLFGFAPAALLLLTLYAGFCA